MKNKNDGNVRKPRLLEYIKKNDSDSLFCRDLDFSLEMFGNTDIVLYGCRRILKYTRNEIVLMAKKFDVSITGECLNCAVYHIQGVEISGIIEDVKFIMRG